MNNVDWVLIDTETTGFSAPVFVVELGAQKMRGWTPQGPSFRRLLNQNTDIPPEAARVHGYTREVLERDGEAAELVYRDFALYAGTLPLVSYNLEYDLEQVLKPEWKRLGINIIGTEGFCALRLAQRLLDPVPAGNCKLQTLRQYYRLPERGAHTALGDVETVADLIVNVLKPIADERGLATWEDIFNYSNSTWYPSRIAFGKYKGRSFREARTDKDLRKWLEWLSESANERTARMGQWYLVQLETGIEHELGYSSIQAAFGKAQRDFLATELNDATAVVAYKHPEVEQLKSLIADSRLRLAELEAKYQTERNGVDSTKSFIFNTLRKHYQRRDDLRLIVEYRSRYLKIFMHEGEQEAEALANDYDRAKAQSDFDYEDAASVAAEKKPLSKEEEVEIKRLWRKLVLLYHPDRFSSQPDKLETYTKLVMEINLAKENNNIKKLQEIAHDPHSFILSQGWSSLDFSESADLKKLRKLLETLNIEILEIMDRLSDLYESADYELHQLSLKNPHLLDEVSAKQSKQLEEEIEELTEEAEKLKVAIEELSGSVPIMDS